MTQAKCIFVAVGIALVATPALAAGQFDLRCEGTHTSPGKPIGKMNQVLHIDLSSSQYCVDDCRAVYPIAGVTASEITLRDTKGKRGDSLMLDVARVNRQTGEFRATFIAHLGLPINVQMTAVCSPQPFTPFPATKF